MISGIRSALGVSGNVVTGVTIQSDLEGILNLKAFSCRYTSMLTNPSKPDFRGIEISRGRAEVERDHESCSYSVVDGEG